MISTLNVKARFAYNHLHGMITFILILTSFFTSFAAAPRFPADQWRYYGGQPGGARYSPLKQINRATVARLERAWTFHTGEIERLPNISPDREPPGGGGYLGTRTSDGVVAFALKE